LTRAFFVTGASGYVGSLFLPRLLQEEPEGEYRVLMRDPGKCSPQITNNGQVEVVVGDLLRPETYARALTGVDTVVHLAATTGRAANDGYFQVNKQGTAQLVQCCLGSGVGQILYASTIAVRYPDIACYPYAQSKAAAEEIIRSSGMAYSIVRPTIVWGANSPIRGQLSHLVRPPLLVVPGNGKARIQPIHELDLVNLLVALIRNQLFHNETYELGGPEALPFETFLRRMYEATTHVEPRFVVRVPLATVRSGLARVEAQVGDVLPVGSGQLSAFVFDGTAQDCPELVGNRDGLLNPSQMISAAQSDAVSQGLRRRLSKEADVFTRYLIGQPPDDYIEKKYVQSALAAPATRTPVDGFDSVCLRLAGLGGVWLQLADTYCTYFFRNATLRKRLVLLLAILESAGVTHRRFQAPRRRTIGASVLLLGTIGLVAAARLLAAGLLLTPCRLGLWLLRSKNAGWVKR
jgi:uncharacterized protein YbjT (DUF2867 family)